MNMQDTTVDFASATNFRRCKRSLRARGFFHLAFAPLLLSAMTAEYTSGPC